MVKNYTNFINEELNPYKYKMASDRLSSKYHSKRKEELLDYYQKSLSEIKPFDIIVKEYTDIDGNILKRGNRNSITTHKVYNGLKISDINSSTELILDIELKNDDITLNLAFQQTGKQVRFSKYRNDIFFGSRGDAIRFFKFAKSMLPFFGDDYKLKVNINDFYISKESWDAIVDEETNVEDEEMPGWEFTSKDLPTPGVDWNKTTGINGEPEVEDDVWDDEDFGISKKDPEYDDLVKQHNRKSFDNWEDDDDNGRKNKMSDEEADKFMNKVISDNGKDRFPPKNDTSKNSLKIINKNYRPRDNKDIWYGVMGTESPSFPGTNKVARVTRDYYLAGEHNHQISCPRCGKFSDTSNMSNLTAYECGRCGLIIRTIGNVLQLWDGGFWKGFF